MTTLCYQAQPEKTLMIDLPGTNGLKIKTILRGSINAPLVVMVHGRPGGNDIRMYLFARYLHENNISSLQLFLYSEQSDTRNLLDISDVATHAADVDTVIEYARKHGAERVIAVGHSYGGLSVLKSKARLDGAVLWDASHGLFWQELSEKSLNRYRTYDENLVIDGRGQGYIISRAMSDNDRVLGDTSKLAHTINCPLFVISASKGSLASFGKMYYDAAQEPKKYLKIPGASHLFLDSDSVLLELFDQTTQWIKKAINK